MLLSVYPFFICIFSFDCYSKSCCFFLSLLKKVENITYTCNFRVSSKNINKKKTRRNFYFIFYLCFFFILFFYRIINKIPIWSLLYYPFCVIFYNKSCVKVEGIKATHVWRKETTKKNISSIPVHIFFQHTYETQVICGFLFKHFLLLTNNIKQECFIGQE